MTAKQRLCRVLLALAAVLVLGLGYALLVMRLGYGIPCTFKLLTGMDCPSCGISRMFLAILQLDFAAAFHYNPVIFCLLPLGIAVLARWVYLYVRRGRKTPEKWMAVAGIFALSVLIPFGFVRNFV